MPRQKTRTVEDNRQSSRAYHARKQSDPSYRAKRSEQFGAWRTTVEGRSSQLLRSAQKRAKDRGTECTITREWVVEKLRAGVCELTGLPLIFVTGLGRSAFSPSIDRIDQTKGYTPENSRVILTAVNIGRGEWDDDTLLLWATALVRKHEATH